MFQAQQETQFAPVALDALLGFNMYIVVWDSHLSYISFLLIAFFSSMWHWLLQQHPKKFIYNVLKDAIFVAKPNLQ